MLNKVKKFFTSLNKFINALDNKHKKHARKISLKDRPTHYIKKPLHYVKK